MKYPALAVTPLSLLTFLPEHTADDRSRNHSSKSALCGLLASMPRDQVIASLAESNMVSPWKNPEGTDTWGVADRNGNHPLVVTCLSRRESSSGRGGIGPNLAQDTMSRTLSRLFSAVFGRKAFRSVLCLRENRTDLKAITTYWRSTVDPKG